jgi:amino acid transporter
MGEDGTTTPLLQDPSYDIFPRPARTRTLNDESKDYTAPVARKELGWSSAYVLVVSRVIGSGIFATPGVIIQSVGSPGLSLILWIVGALVAVLGLVIDMEFGCMLPFSGGYKVYLEYIYSKPRFLASTVVAVQAVLLGFTATNCIIFAKYAIWAFNSEDGTSERYSTAIAAMLLTAITIVHSCFYKTGIVIQNALGWVKIGLTCFMIMIGFGVLLRFPIRKPTDDPSGLEGFWAEANFEFNTLATALLKVIYSYAGLDNINNVLSEVKNPVRIIRTVGPAALLSTCFLYVLINVAYLVVVPINEIKESRELIAALFFQRLGLGRSVLPILICLSAAGNVMVVTFSLVSEIDMESSSADNTTGASQPGNSPVRIFALFQHPRIRQAIWCTNGRLIGSLRPVASSDCSAFFKKRLLLHHRCRGLRWTTLCSGYCSRPRSAA